jgi:hypothetical protein
VFTPEFMLSLKGPCSTSSFIFQPGGYPFVVTDAEAAELGGAFDKMEAEHRPELTSMTCCAPTCWAGAQRPEGNRPRRFIMHT